MVYENSRANTFAKPFNSEVSDQVKSILKGLSFDTLSTRNNVVDLTHLNTYTIDDASAKEIDDAISLDRSEDGEYLIWVHIADASRYLPNGSPIDVEARKRGTSIYLTDNFIPMLPIDLVDRAISLKAGNKRVALSILVNIDREGLVKLQKVVQGIVKPRYSLTYEEANELIEMAPPQEPDLNIISDILHRRFLWRRSQGAINLEQISGKFIIEENKLSVRYIENSPSRVLVSESMILMGSVLADYAYANKIPVPYRIQLHSNLPSLVELNMLQQGSIRNSAIRSCLSKATFSTKPYQHFGLGLSIPSFQ